MKEKGGLGGTRGCDLRGGRGGRILVGGGKEFGENLPPGGKGKVGEKELIVHG